jgi:GNAT superfamily N-acetyltransferase
MAPLARQSLGGLLKIAEARAEDAEVLTNIAFASKQHWGYSKRLMESWRTVLTIQPTFIATHETYKASIQERILGFYSLSRGSEPIRLEHLWVLPENMGRGVGRELFLHAVGRVKAAGFSSLLIESDPNATGFYEQMGAWVTGTHLTEIDGRPRELPVLLYKIA